ncbi:hypothetical protein DXG01_008078 [Tephrocybe rancida]|nr:hypothetical protein DXG01_008078 [Tephrocybe rancida]
MVVNRKLSVSAAPPVSRTSSTQPAPRAPKTPTPSGFNDSKSKVPTKTKPPAPRQRRKSLHSYRTHIINSYVVPPIETLYQHAEPYTEPIKPYVTATTDFTRTHVIPRAATFLEVAGNQYRSQLAPWLHWLIIEQLWNGVVKPIYFDTLHPHLERHTRPHRFYYHKFLVPGARKGAAHAHATYIRAMPHAQHYLARAQENAFGAYETARPHVLGVYQRVRPHVVVILNQVQMQALGLASKASKVRREFVDPHVRRMLEKASESQVSSSQTESTTVAPAQPASDTTAT